MKLLFFDDYKFGVMKGDNVVDCSDVVKDIPNIEPQHIINGVIENWDTLPPASWRRKRPRAPACR